MSSDYCYSLVKSCCHKLQHLHQEVMKTVLFGVVLSTHSQTEGTTRVNLISKCRCINVSTINGKIAGTKLMQGAKDECDLSCSMIIFVAWFVVMCS